jgi:hypothetical protein
MAWVLAMWANPLFRKIIIYCAITLGILYGLRLYGNRQWAKGEAQGRLTVTKDIEKRKAVEWKAKETAIAQAAADLASEKASVAVAIEQLRADRADLSRTLNVTLAQIQRERIRQYANAASVPDNRIWDDIRAVSRELAAQP